MKNKKTESYLTEEILTVVKNSTKEITISFLQRKFKIGFGRAARIFDELIENGIIEKPQEPKISLCKIVSIERKEPKQISDEVLFEKIVEYIKSVANVSTSLLQRKFKLGYSRAATMMDLLEEKKIVSPDDGTGKRAILIG